MPLIMKVGQPLMKAVQIGSKTNTVDILEKAGATIPKEAIEGF